MKKKPNNTTTITKINLSSIIIYHAGGGKYLKGAKVNYPFLLQKGVARIL